jgi:hypothetical protein|tara:strand:- start:612 stop:782 length:171 start_codon:yes stop_codon:yes gene_type:complete
MSEKMLISRGALKRIVAEEIKKYLRKNKDSFLKEELEALKEAQQLLRESANDRNAE